MAGAISAPRVVDDESHFIDPRVSQPDLSRSDEHIPRSRAYQIVIGLLNADFLWVHRREICASNSARRTTPSRLELLLERGDVCISTAW